MEKIKIITTIGPNSLNKRTIQKMDESGVDIFRINLSHTAIEDYENVINQISSWTDKPIYSDTEGAQLRTGRLLNNTIKIKKNSIVKFSFYSIGEDIIPLYPKLKNDIFSIGELLFIDFNSVVIQIIEMDENIIYGRAISGGIIGSNKGIGTDKIKRLPYITEKDKAIIDLAIKMKQNYFCLSFASSGEDVQLFRDLFPYEIKITSKIENRRGINNLEDICKKSDEILIDRGDLSRDIELSAIIIAQKQIIKIANKLKTPVNIATNLLESMISKNEPTRAEISDITNALLDGASGLVLAAETAIGENPINSVKMVKRVINKFNYFKTHQPTISKIVNIGELCSPHGGLLINQFMKNTEKLQEYPKLVVSEDIISDCFQIGEGTYSPITGFMNIDEINSVLNDNQLLDGNSWPIPIVLQTDEINAARLKGKNKVTLTDTQNRIIAIIENANVEKMDSISKIAKAWFMTNNIDHPGVKKLYNSGEYILSGKVFIVNKPSDYIKPYEISPYQARRVFLENYWEKIVGFHTRNIPHKGHEHIQFTALNRANADALFISPVLGNHKSGDFKSDAIITGYKALIDSNRYDPYGALLGGINTYSRFSGHREAIFTAICRQNYGCSHFVVGRDHAGINGYYKSVDVEEYCCQFQDLKIKILFFNEVVYNEKENKYFEIGEAGFLNKNEKKISGTICRDLLEKNTSPPEYLISKEVAKSIIKIPSFINE